MQFLWAFLQQFLDTFVEKKIKQPKSAENSRIQEGKMNSVCFLFFMFYFFIKQSIWITPPPPTHL